MPGETHSQQLERIAFEAQSIVKEKGFINFITGLNIGIIILDIVLAFAALLALLSAAIDGPVGVGLAGLLAALALIVTLLDFIGKIVHSNQAAANDERLQRLKAELERKKKELEGEKAKLPGG